MAITLIRFIRLFLLGLIIVGLGLIVTQRLWVPSLVNFILSQGALPEAVMPETMGDEMHTMNSSLTGKSGDAFDQAFIRDMIVHHQGAIEMAQSAIMNAKHQEVKDLAQKIITAQDAEITTMQSWQKAWYGTGK